MEVSYGTKLKGKKEQSKKGQESVMDQVKVFIY